MTPKTPRRLGELVRRLQTHVTHVTVAVFLMQPVPDGVPHELSIRQLFHFSNIPAVAALLRDDDMLWDAVHLYSPQLQRNSSRLNVVRWAMFLTVLPGRSAVPYGQKGTQRYITAVAKEARRLLEPAGGWGGFVAIIDHTKAALVPLAMEQRYGEAFWASASSMASLPAALLGHLRCPPDFAPLRRRPPGDPPACSQEMYRKNQKLTPLSCPVRALQ